MCRYGAPQTLLGRWFNVVPAEATCKVLSSFLGRLGCDRNLSAGVLGFLWDQPGIVFCPADGWIFTRWCSLDEVMGKWWIRFDLIPKSLLLLKWQNQTNWIRVNAIPAFGWSLLWIRSLAVILSACKEMTKLWRHLFVKCIMYGQWTWQSDAAVAVADQQKQKYTWRNQKRKTTGLSPVWTWRCSRYFQRVTHEVLCWPPSVAHESGCVPTIWRFCQNLAACWSEKSIHAVMVRCWIRVV